MSVAVVNPPKALIALIGMITIAALLVLNSIPVEAGTGMLGAIIGYSIGNGIAAATHHKVQPIFGDPKDFDHADTP